MTSDTKPPAPDDPSSTVHETGSDPQHGVWKIGTLVYTRGGLAVLFAWLFWGDFAWQARERAVGPVAQLLLRHLHASDQFVGWMSSSLPAALGMLIGPILNTLSDRYRGRRGRRIPFLLGPTPFAVLALFGLAFTPTLGNYLHDLLGAQSPGLVSARLIVFGICWTVFEVSAIATAGIFYALINDVVPHELIGRSFGGFRAVSLFAGILFFNFVLGHAEQHLQTIFIVISLLYGVGLTLMCLKVKEGEYPPPEPLVKRRGADRLAPIIAYFRETFSKPYYVWIYLAISLALLAPGPVNTFSLFYAKSIGMSLSLYGKYISLTYAISFCLSFLLGWLADRFHPLRLTIISITLYAVSAILGGLFARTPGTFAVAFVAHGVFSGCLFTVVVPTYQLLFPKARFGEFYSAANLLLGLFSVMLAPQIGKLLDATGHIYRYTFLISGIIGALAILILMIVYRNFMALGGPKRYVAPE